jgi:S-methylmethionine-dependent homocysteine/selenocysteine methylase
VSKYKFKYKYTYNMDISSLSSASRIRQFWYQNLFHDPPTSNDVVDTDTTNCTTNHLHNNHALPSSSSSSSSSSLPSPPPPPLHHKKVIVFDGGLGEELIQQGCVPYDSNLWSAVAMVQPIYHPQVQHVHESFLCAGAQMITTNTYGIVPGVGLVHHPDIHHYCTLAGQIARRAILEFQHQYPTHSYPDRWVLGSLGPLVSSYCPNQIMSRKDGVTYYTTIVRALEPYVDAYVAETLSTTEEAIQVMEALRQAPPSSSSSSSSSPIPAADTTPAGAGGVPSPPPTPSPTPPHALWISFTVQEDGNLRSHENVVDALSYVLDYYEATNGGSIDHDNNHNNSVQRTFSYIEMNRID